MTGSGRYPHKKKVNVHILYKIFVCLKDGTAYWVPSPPAAVSAIWGTAYKSLYRYEVISVVLHNFNNSTTLISG
jgi:hypothetical protein